MTSTTMALMRRQAQWALVSPSSRALFGKSRHRGGVRAAWQLIKDVWVHDRTLGGQLRVESKVGEGSRFTIILPFRLAPLDTTDRHDNRSLLSRSSGSVRPSTQRTISFQGRRATSSSGSLGGSGGSDINSLIADMSSALQPQSGVSTNGSQGSSLGGRGGSGGAGRTKSLSSSLGSRSNGTGVMSSARNSNARSAGRSSGGGSSSNARRQPRARGGSIGVNDSAYPIRAIKMGQGPPQLSPTGEGDDVDSFAGGDRTATQTPKPVRGYTNGHEQDHEHGDGPSTSSSAPVNQGDVKVRDFEKEDEEARFEEQQKKDKDRQSHQPKSLADQVNGHNGAGTSSATQKAAGSMSISPMRVLVVEVSGHILCAKMACIVSDIAYLQDDRVNRMIIHKRLVTDGHEVSLGVLSQTRVTSLMSVYHAVRSRGARSSSHGHSGGRV